MVEDVGRISKRSVIDILQWKENPEPASAVVESPIYRNAYGLWEHQKYFVNLAFSAHKGPHGARFVLADQAGIFIAALERGAPRCLNPTAPAHAFIFLQDLVYSN